MLKDCLHVVEHELASDEGLTDVKRIEAILAAVASSVRSNDAPAVGCDYRDFLERLADLYAQGCDQRENDAFAASATGYSALIEAVARKYPDLDYTIPIGQLLELMIRLFRTRDNNWKLVYENLRAIPDDVSTKKRLIRVCSADIREWYDAGVQNLFSLQEDLEAKIEYLTSRAKRIDRQTRAAERATARVRRRLDPSGTGKVAILEERIKLREIDALKRKRDETLDELEGRKDTLGLIESDIREFEGILRDARRAYHLRVI